MNNTYPILKTRYVPFVAVITLLVFNMSCKEIQGPAGPPGDVRGLESLTDPSVLPKIIYVYPPVNTPGPYEDFKNGQIRVRFNKIMNVASVKKAISLSVANGDIGIDTSSISSERGDDFVMCVKNRSGVSCYSNNFIWQVGELYKLSIEASAEDINGNKLSSNYSMAFQPEPVFRIIKIYPPTGSLNVMGNTNIYCYVNSPVDSSFFSSIHISPSLPGSWSFSYSKDSTIFYFFSERTLNLNSTYTITVDANAKDRYGHPISGQVVSSFSTIPFKVTSTNPSNGNNAVSILLDGIDINFSGAIVKEKAEKAFNITPAVSGHFIRPYHSVLKYIFDSPLQMNTQYTVTIDTLVRSMDGDTLESPYSFSFKTSSINVTEVYPYNGNTDVSLSSEIAVIFSALIDTGTVAKAFSILPVTAGYFEMIGNGFRFYPLNGLQGKTEYKIKVDTMLYGKNGDKLLKPYMFSFKTSDFKVNYSSPYNGDTGVSLSLKGIRVSFNGLIDSSTVGSAFHIVPFTTGDFSFGNNYEFLFTPAMLLSETQYTVTIDTSLRSKSGSKLSSPYMFSFKTLPFKIYYTSPSNGSSNVWASSNISIYFSAEIDTGTARNAFNITPSTNGYLRLSGNKILFDPDPSLFASANYTVTIDTSIRSITGAKLSSEYKLSFQTEPFKIIGTTPANGDTSVELQGRQIRISFSGSIDSAAIRKAFSISPPTSGRFDYYFYRGFSFIPDNGFLADTWYTVAIDTTLRSTSGNNIESKYIFSFKTQPFKIVSTYPSDGQTNLVRNTYFAITTNTLIDTSTVRAAFILPGISGNFYYYGGNTFFFVPAGYTPFDANTTYTVTISTALKSKAGSAIKAPYSFSFTTGN